MLRASRLNQVTVAFVRYGSEVLLDGYELGAYHVNVPLSGSVASTCGPRETVATPTRATVFTPRERSVLPSWTEDASQIWIKIDQLEKLLISSLLRTQAHNHLDELCGALRPARPRTVKRVVDLVEACPEVNYTSDLARHAGVGARRLEIAFKESFNTSPMGYVRKVKLGRARAGLLAGEPVMTVAHHWGFNHLGRFSATYRRTYGELPSDTLRRGRIATQGPPIAPAPG